MQQLRSANIISPTYRRRPEAANVRGVLQVATAGVVDRIGGGGEVDVLGGGEGGVKVQCGEADGEYIDGVEGFGKAEEVTEDCTESGVTAHDGWGLDNRV